MRVGLRRQGRDEIRDPSSGDFEQIRQQARAEPRRVGHTAGVEPVDQLDDVGERGRARQRNRRHGMAVPAERQLAQIAVEEMTGNVAHAPRPRERRPRPVGVAQTTEQRDQFGMQRRKERRGVESG